MLTISFLKPEVTRMLKVWRHYQVDVDDEVVLLPDHALLPLHLPHADRGDARPHRPPAAPRLQQRVLMRNILHFRHAGTRGYEDIRWRAAACGGNIPRGVSRSSNCQESSQNNYRKWIVWEKVRKVRGNDNIRPPLFSVNITRQEGGLTKDFLILLLWDTDLSFQRFSRSNIYLISIFSWCLWKDQIQVSSYT